MSSKYKFSIEDLKANNLYNMETNWPIEGVAHRLASIKGVDKVHVTGRYSLSLRIGRFFQADAVKILAEIKAHAKFYAPTEGEAYEVDER